MVRSGWMVVAMLGGCTSTTTTDEATTDGSDPVDPIPTLTTVTRPTSGTTAETGTDTGTLVDSVSGLGYELHPDYPTVVEVSWSQTGPGPVQVEYSFDKGVWHQAPLLEGEAGLNEQTLVGIPYDVQTDWRIVAFGATVAAKKPIITPAPPGNLPLPTVVSAVSSSWDPSDAYLLTSVTSEARGWGTNGPFHTVILDRQGRVVWSRRAQSGHWTLYAQRSVTGDHLIYDDFSFFGGGDEVAIRSYLDEVISETDMPGFHHAFIELPDGTLAWGSKAHGGGEALVELAPGAKKETVVWTCWDDFDGRTRDSCTSNSLYYQPASDTYVYSFYTLEAVAAIDRSKGTTIWYAGRDVDKGALSFNPPESQFWWQHGIKLSATGTFLVSTHDDDRSPDSVLGVEYEVDLAKGELRRIFEYDSGAYAPTNGDIRRLANGNLLHTVGSSGVIKEVDAKGATVWHLDFKQKGDGQRLLGRSEYLSDLYELLAPDPKVGSTK